MKKQIQKLAVLIGMVSIAAIGCKKDDSTSVTSTSTVKTNMTSAVSVMSNTTVQSSSDLTTGLTATIDADGNSVYTLTGDNSGTITISADGNTITFAAVVVDGQTTVGTMVMSGTDAESKQTLNLTITSSEGTVQYKDYTTTTTESSETINGTVVVTAGTTVYTVTDTNVVFNSEATYASAGTETVVITGGSTYKFEFLANDLCNLTVDSEATQSNVKQSDLGF